MRIGYFADGPWAHRAFELITNTENIEIAFIVPRIDTQDSTLFNFSQSHGIDYIHPAKVNSSSFQERAKTYDCDLFVSMSFNQIFRMPTINIPRLGTINCHAGKLPFYRGRNILNWALINDEKEFGITVHYVDEGIDTGDIILQKCFPICDSDDYGTLLKVAHEECATLLLNAITLLQSGQAKRIRQNSIHPTGFYCGRRIEGDEVIDWSRSSRDVFNFIRSVSAPGPIATTTIHEDEVKINRANMVGSAPQYLGTPGQILNKTPHGFLVKTSDSFIEISEIKTGSKLRVGDRLGSPK